MAFKVSKKFQDMIDRNNQISADTKAVEERWKSWTPPKQNTNDIFQDAQPTQPSYQPTKFQQLKEIPSNLPKQPEKIDWLSLKTYKDIITPAKKTEGLNFDPNFDSVLSAKLKKNINIDPNSVNPFLKFLLQTSSKTGEQAGDNLVTAAVNKKLKKPLISPTRDTTNYNLNPVANVGTDILGTAGDPISWLGGPVAGRVGGAIRGSAKLAKAGKLSKFLVPLAGEGAVFGGMLSAGDEAKNYINNPSQFNLGSSVGKTIGGATTGALGNVALGGLLHGIGSGIKGINQIKNLKGKTIDLKASEIPRQWDSYPSSPYTPPQIKPYSGQFTVNTNRVAQQAQQDLEDAIVAVQNHFGTNQLTPDEIARIKPELGIDFEQLINRVENPQVDIRGIGERAKYGQHIGLNNVMARPDQSLYNLKYPRDIIPEPRPLQTPVFNQQQPQINPSKFQATGNLPTPQQEVINQFKKPILKKKEIVNNMPNEPVVSPNNQSIPNIPVDNVQASTGLNNANKPNSIISDIVKQQESNIPQQNIQSTPIQNQFEDNISKFRTNTLERYTKLTPEERAQLNPDNYSFIKETNKEWQDAASTNIEKDMYEVMDRLTKQSALTGGIDSAEGALIGEKLLKKARETGNPLDMAEYRRWTEIIAEKTRETARAFKSTDLSYDKSSPAGIIQKTQSTIDGLIPKELHEKINSEAKKIRFEIKKVDNEALDQIAKEFDEIIKPNMPKDFKYEMAKEITPSKFQDTGNLPDKDLDRFIKNSLKELGVNVGKLVRDFKQQDAINDITRYMVKNSGLSEPEATALANQIKTRLAQITAEKKQQIINNMFKEKKVSIPKNDFEKTMELINLGAYDDVTIRDLIKKRDNLPMLDTEDINKIYDLIENANKIPDKNSYEYKLEMGKIDNIIGDKVAATWMDYVLTGRHISMLGNLITFLRNISGNAILTPFEAAKNTVMAPLDKLMSLKDGKRYIFAPTLKSTKVLLKGMGTGAKEAFLDAKYGVNTSPTSGQFELSRTIDNGTGHYPFEINKKRMFKKVPILNQLEKGLNFMMSIGDRPFYQGNYDKALYQIMKHNKVDTPTPEMIKYAKESVAEDATYINKSSFAKKAMEIKKGFGPVGHITMPYVRTPANIADKFLDYLPTGFAKAAFELGKGSNNKFAKEFYKGLYKDSANLEFDRKKFLDRLGRAIVGSGVIAGSSSLASSGKLTGSENKNESLANIEKQAGKLPFAIKNGDKYISYDWAQPMSTLVATGANIGNNKLSKKDAMLQSTKLLQNQSFLKGINDLFSSGNIATGLYNAIVKAPGQFNPTLVKQTTKFNDPYVREKSGEPKITALGKPMLQNYGNNSFFNNFINPAKVSNYNPTKSEQLIIDLANRTGDTKFLPTEQDEKIRVGGKDVTLTPEQLTKFRQTIGLNLDKLYKQIANNKTFIQSSDKDKMSILNNFKDKIVSDAKDNIMDSKNKMSNYNNEAISKKQFEMARDEIYKGIDKKYKLTKDQNGKIIKDVNYDRNTKAKENIQSRISPKKINNMSEQQKLELIKQLRKGGY